MLTAGSLCTGRIPGRAARNAELRILGNGVVSAQGALAYTQLPTR